MLRENDGFYSKERKAGFIENTAMRHRRGGGREVTVTSRRYEPQSAAKKKKLSSSSVSAFATVVSDNVVHYVDLKQHFLKKLGEM